MGMGKSMLREIQDYKIDRPAAIDLHWIRTVERSTGPFDPLRPASGLTKTAGAFHSDKLKNRPPYGDRFFNRCDWIRTSGLCVPNHIPGDSWGIL